MIIIILTECTVCCGLILKSAKEILMCNGEGCFCRIHISCWNPDIPFKEYYCRGCRRIDFNYKPHDPSGSKLKRNDACYEWNKTLKKHMLYGEEMQYDEYMLMIKSFEYEQPSLRNRSEKFKRAFEWNPFYLQKLQKQIKGIILLFVCQTQNKYKYIYIYIYI